MKTAQFRPSYSGLVFSEDFTSAKTVADHGGTVTSAPTIGHGARFDGTDDKIAFPAVSGVKSVSFWVTLATTNEDIMRLSSSCSIEAVAGTLTATGVSSPTIYVNSAATSAIGTSRSHVVVTTATAFNADDVTVGADDAYGELKIENLLMFSSTLTAEEAKDLFEQDAYAELGRPLIDLPMRSSYYKENGTELLADGDMETAGVASWTAGQNATMTKVSGARTGGTGTLALRVAYNGSNAPNAYQSILATNKTYRVTGWCRGDGAFKPTVYLGTAAASAWQGTASTNWQYFSLSYTVPGSENTRFALASNATSAGWAEFDDVSVQLMENVTENKGILGGTAKMGDGTTTTTFPALLSPHGARFDGSNDYVSTASPPSGTYSFVFLLRTSLSGSGNDYIFDNRSGGGAGYLILDATAGSLSKSSGTLYVDGTPGTSVSKGVLHAVCVAGMSVTAGTSLIIGASSSLTGTFFHGDVLDMTVVSGTLTPQQVKKLHHDMVNSLNV